MTAETVAQFAALEAQAEKIMAIFAQAGYERVAPSFIQPADVFLNRIGEALRNRTYVFTDPDGQELCLRPDLTIPSSRIYLARNPGGEAKARYAYNGPAFRYQPDGGDALRPREFRQAGIENYGHADKEAADVEVLRLIVEAVETMGLRGFQIRCGDLGLFHALLEGLPIPARWRQRLMHHFWRPDAFQRTLNRLAVPAKTPSDQGLAELARTLPSDDPAAAEEQLAAYLESRNVPLIGARTLSEISARLTAIAADMGEEPLSPQVVELVGAYLQISGPPAEALDAIEALLRQQELDLSRALSVCRRRQALIAETGIDQDKLLFDADFGRTLEYYSGFVFQIELPGRGVPGQIAGGGRYDGLLRSIGAEQDTAAVGSAIHTERLLAAVGGLS